GQVRHGVIAWLLATVPLLAVTVAMQYALHAIAAPLAWVWSVTVLYVTMGFRQFSHYFTDILRALNNEDPGTARRYLGEWLGESAEEFSPTEIARVAIEQGLLASHRCVFGSIAWFVVLGPAGAVLYRASEMLASQWDARASPGGGEFARFAARFHFW